MKKLLVLSFLTLFSKFFVAAQTNSNSKFIEITGFASTSVEPDIIYYTISLPSAKNNVEEEKEASKEDSVDVTVEKKIKEDNNLKWIKIREILGQQNIKEEEDPDTKNYSIGNKFNLYTLGSADDEVIVKVASLKKLETLITQLKTVKGCKGSISKVENSNMVALQEETLMKALTHAKEKAGKIATKMNIKLGKVIQITEQAPLNSLLTNFSKDFSLPSLGANVLSGKGKNSSGKLSLTDSIVVRFAIEE